MYIYIYIHTVYRNHIYPCTSVDPACRSAKLRQVEQIIKLEILEQAARAATGKALGKPWENGDFIGKPWENHGKMMIL